MRRNYKLTATETDCMIFNLGPIGDWLGERLTANAEDLTDEQMQGMKKDDLIKAVKELQAKLKNSNRQLTEYQHRIHEAFFKIR